ncbi:Fic family protein [Oxalobacteraceae bacterium R-40]|uniref:Fic family protein n=1 Tax=Keguizhuia sedimenti TaxID=3064264 RepID=A0ABU1BNX8_9BURK|nr:Fic family protein [Oxalobacteraceae bacterium R-40]
MNIQLALNELDTATAQLKALELNNREQQDRAFNKVRLEWNYHSNAMEGNQLTFGETRALLLRDLTATAKPLKDHLDIQGHDQAITALLEFIKSGDELTEIAIREFHRLLLVKPYEERSIGPDGLPRMRKIEIGDYKKIQNFVVTSDGTQHEFANPIDTPAQIAELISWFREQREKKEHHPVIIATIFHHKFVAIHPFDDGNGRMGRLLMNLILIQHGYPPAVIRLDEKNEYIQALERANAGEFEGLAHLVARSTLNTAQLFLKAARGESIDDLTDFDKKLQLLSQTLDSVATADGREKTQEEQNFVIARFISPLLACIWPRLTQIERHFAVSNTHLFFFNDGKANKIEAASIKVMLEKLQERTANIKLSKLHLFFHASGYRFKSTQDFLCNTEVYFHHSHFAIQLHLTGSHTVEIYRGRYTDLADQSEAEELAVRALEQIVAAFQKIAGSSMPST